MASRQSGVEIERKFLVAVGDWRARAGPGTRILQGYLARGENGVVRIRIAEDRAFLTVKGPNRGLARAEFEYRVPVSDAEAMLELCVEPPVEKIRYVVDHDGHHWEVDEFEGANAGLVTAEIELEREDLEFERPAWLGPEVSHLTRYANSNLSRHPYSEWSATERRVG